MKLNEEVKQTPVAVDKLKIVSNGNLVEAPLYERQSLKPGQQVHGPAIIKEPTGTNVIEPIGARNLINLVTFIRKTYS